MAAVAVVAEANPLVVVKKSPIHGRGVFAARRIEEGELIGTYEGPRTQRNGTYVLWVLDEDGTGYGINGKNELRYLNHCSTPNADFCEHELYALRTIEPGEEITFHYGEAWQDV